jgi:uncharacterized protein (TIGR03000 family)
MTRKNGLCFAVATVLAVAMAGDAQAFWGSRGSWGGCGSSGGSWGGGGSWGSNGSSGSWGSSGSHGGFLRRIFNGSHGSNGSKGGYSSCGSSGGSNGSAGGAAYYGGSNYYAVSRPAANTTLAVAQSAPAVKTQLTLRVPADAKVTMAGVPTKQTGEVRQFTTSKLASGQAWDNYQIVVEMERNGKMVREERTITLTGGVPQELSIDMPTTTLAQVSR